MTMHDRSQPSLASPRPASLGFTLIELMVVIAIIAILASIALLLAGRVAEGGRRGQTENILRTLEASLDNLAADRGSAKAPAKFLDGRGVEFAIIDARAGSSALQASAIAEPSTELFLLATREVESVQSAVSAIPGDFTDREETIPTERNGRLVRLREVTVLSQGAPTDAAGNRLQSLDVRDPWGNRIRFVHPAYHGGYGEYFTPSGSGSWTTGATRPNLTVRLKNGAGTIDRQFRRSARPFDPTTVASQGSGKARFIGDADEGLTSGGRPYFYSPGADRDPGTRADNVYAGNRPQFPTETRDLE
jgi:prepilin-type N-terminal cleavage/methylation domain-containing protein